LRGDLRYISVKNKRLFCCGLGDHDKAAAK